jgi:hypothetical protein
MISPRVVLLQWGRCPQFVCGFLAASILLTSGLQGLMQFPARSQSLETPLSLIQSAPPVSSSVSRTAPVRNVSQAAPATQAQDPLHSAYPIPWGMIWQNQTQATQTGKVITLRSVSDAIASPDGQRNAHSEIRLELHPAVTQSRVVSHLIITNAKGAEVQKIASSMHLGDGIVKETSGTAAVGTLSILMPATWSKDGQQLLARQFEAVFGSDVSSDYALVWNRNTQQVKTVAPVPQDYDTAILLGWSHRNPDQILFRTAILGEKNTALVAVNRDGTTVASEGDRILPLGRSIITAPAASQARR